MPVIRLTIQFDGTDFHGWQLQRDLRTVQGVLGAAVETLLEERVVLRSSSRTDAGVHAAAMPVVLRTERQLPLRAYLLGLNALLPDDLSVIAAAEVAGDFDVRRWARGKTYRYRIWNAPFPSALEARYSWHVARLLDVGAIQAGADRLLGEHDFSAFRAAECDSKSTRRLMESIVAQARAEHLIEIELCANAFMRNMVRIIVGTLVDVGLGRRTPEDVERVLAGRDRTQAGRTAPPQGLFLREVRYPS